MTEPKHQTSKVRMTDRKRAAVLKAALEEFKKNGYTLTSMDKIAERAKVSKRTVYHHFPGKQILFKTIIRTLHEEIAGLSPIVYDSAKPLREQLNHIAEQQIGLLTSRKYIELARISFSEYIRSPELAQTFFSDIRDEGPGFLNWIRSAQNDGKLRKVDPGIPARQFIAMIKSFFFWPVLFGGNLPNKQAYATIINSTVDMFLEHYESK